MHRIVPVPLPCASALAAIVLIAAPAAFRSTQAPPLDPFGFFAPWIAVSEGDRRRLARDEVVARTLHGGDSQIAVFVATRLNAKADALATWTRAIDELKQSRFVLAVGRFSDPPARADLAGLALDEQDLDEIAKCAPGDCGLKLSVPEINALKAAVSSSGNRWRDGVQEEFRRVLVSRVEAYRRGGLAALPPTADRKTPRRLDEAFDAILHRSPYLTRLPNALAWLKDYPSVNASGVESFFYWSKEHYGSGKPVISVTHVAIVRPDSNADVPAVLVAGKQIFATHYIEGALGLTMVARGTDGVDYLVYVNRSKLDLLSGFWGGLTRSVLESRLKRHAPQIVRGLRERLESRKPDRRFPPD